MVLHQQSNFVPAACVLVCLMYAYVYLYVRHVLRSNISCKFLAVYHQSILDEGDIFETNTTALCWVVVIVIVMGGRPSQQRSTLLFLAVTVKRQIYTKMRVL